eukprot:GHVT01070446.1.p1 GENE.GHVT01070446.1~~GHVT01070446.1.p1  ORF type:complete len:385 (-),score=60.02 GHVT01070446.1:472-1626(-)
MSAMISDFLRGLLSSLDIIEPLEDPSSLDLTLDNGLELNNVILKVEKLNSALAAAEVEARVESGRADGLRFSYTAFPGVITLQIRDLELRVRPNIASTALRKIQQAFEELAGQETDEAYEDEDALVAAAAAGDLEELKRLKWIHQQQKLHALALAQQHKMAFHPEFSTQQLHAKEETQNKSLDVYRPIPRPPCVVRRAQFVSAVGSPRGKLGGSAAAAAESGASPVGFPASYGEFVPVVPPAIPEGAVGYAARPVPPGYGVGISAPPQWRPTMPPPSHPTRPPPAHLMSTLPPSTQSPYLVLKQPGSPGSMPNRLYRADAVGKTIIKTPSEQGGELLRGFHIRLAATLCRKFAVTPRGKETNHTRCLAAFLNPPPSSNSRGYCC